MTWRDVFNTQHKMWVLDDARNMAEKCGYRFFYWNGWIISVATEEKICLVGDLTN